MATALKHKQRSSRSYQKNKKTMGSAVMFMANKSAAGQAACASRAGFSKFAQELKNVLRGKKGDR